MTAPTEGNVEGDGFGFVDAHIHFYDLQHPELRYRWLEPDFVHPVIGNINGIKALEYFPANYQAETRFAGVVGAVHVQAALGSRRPGARERLRRGRGAGVGAAVRARR